MGHGEITGVVRRLGRPVAAEVALHRFLVIDTRDPYGAFRGFEGDRLQLHAAAAAREPLATREVGPGGRFSFDRLLPGFYEVHAHMADGARGVVAVVVPVDGARIAATVHVPDRIASLAGTVRLQDGRPFEGWVEAQPGYGWAPAWPCAGTHVAATDGEGRFAFSGLPHGRLNLSAVKDEEVRYTWGPVWLPRSEPLEIEVPSTAPVCRGRVVDASTGAPVVGAEIVAWGGAGRDGPTLRRRAVTNEQGDYDVVLPPRLRQAVAHR